MTTKKKTKAATQMAMLSFSFILYSRRESNSYLIFRRDLFYPLNYGSIA